MRISDWSSDVCSSDLDAGIMTGRWSKLCQLRDLAVERRHHRLGQYGCGARGVTLRQARRAELAGEARRHGGRRGRLPAQRLQLLERAILNEIRRGHAERGIAPQAFYFL